MGRFTQAISEGDGISVIPVLSGDVAQLAPAAEAAGAEAVAVTTAADAEVVRARTGLPIIVRGDDIGAIARARADACIVAFDALDAERVAEVYGVARELDLDCAVDVWDEEGLEHVLELVDPDIVLISERDPGRGEEELERTLDLLPDVPAGKLVIAESSVVAREQVVALERAGVDGVLVVAAGGDVAAVVAELAGRTPA